MKRLQEKEAVLAATDQLATTGAAALRALRTMTEELRIVNLKLSPRPAAWSEPVSAAAPGYNALVDYIVRDIAGMQYRMTDDQERLALRQFLLEGGDLEKVADKLHFKIRGAENYVPLDSRSTLIGFWLFANLYKAIPDSSRRAPSREETSRLYGIGNAVTQYLFKYSEKLPAGELRRFYDDAVFEMGRNLSVPDAEARTIIAWAEDAYNGYWYPMDLNAWAAVDPSKVKENFAKLGDKVISMGSVSETEDRRNLEEYLGGYRNKPRRGTYDQWALDSAWLWAKYGLNPDGLKEFAGMGVIQNIELQYYADFMRRVGLSSGQLKNMSHDAQLLWERWELLGEIGAAKWTMDRDASADVQRLRESISAMRKKIYLLSQQLAGNGSDAAMAAGKVTVGGIGYSGQAVRELWNADERFGQTNVRVRFVQLEKGYRLEISKADAYSIEHAVPILLEGGDASLPDRVLQEFQRSALLTHYLSIVPYTNPPVDLIARELSDALGFLRSPSAPAAEPNDDAMTAAAGRSDVLRGIAEGTVNQVRKGLEKFRLQGRILAELKSVADGQQETVDLADARRAGQEIGLLNESGRVTDQDVAAVVNSAIRYTGRDYDAELVDKAMTGVLSGTRQEVITQIGSWLRTHGWTEVSAEIPTLMSRHNWDKGSTKFFQAPSNKSDILALDLKGGNMATVHGSILDRGPHALDQFSGIYLGRNPAAAGELWLINRNDGMLVHVGGQDGGKIAFLHGNTSANLPPKEQLVELKVVDAAMPPGGIDMNAQNMQMNAQGQKVDMTFDPAMIEQFKRGDFTGLTPVILNITPITNIRPLLGLAPEAVGTPSANADTVGKAIRREEEV
jgi:hypothetical protein